MTKLKQAAVIVAVTLITHLTVSSQTTYPVYYTIADSVNLKDKIELQTVFAARNNAAEYIAKLPTLLQSRGYVTASVDTVKYDSLFATVHLYLGKPYKWTKIKTASADKEILEAVKWNEKEFFNSALYFNQVQSWQEKILNYLEENGYPFAKIYLDSIQLYENDVEAALKIDRGSVYKIDSIRVYGDAKVSKELLQRHLEIGNGSIYSKKKLQDVSNKISELLYLQEEKPSDLTLLGTGSVLNLYLKQKKSSQFNVLIGFLPNPDPTATKRFQVSGEANILLRNALSGGETIGLNWQQLQQQSPRLNILYEHPYIFHSPFGFNFQFNMFRQDSTFLTINANIGASYKPNAAKTATVFLQRWQSIVNGINIADVVNFKRLPQEADVSSLNLGFTYEFNNTNYRFNPQKGSELVFTSSGGTKKIKRNNQILELQDPNDPAFKFESLYDTIKLKGYQFRVHGLAAHYFPLGRQSAVKTAINAGIYQSENTFRNELFQIGGYRLLRGFDEESQYVSRYVIATVEYRYLIGRNSNFFVFTDGGWGKHHTLFTNNHTYFGAGMGISFETKAGIFNLMWAVGKRDDTELNLRGSKVHFGFANYF
ncbi:MAG: POTRA domain-containing protein [Chitinophagaceae bacterium]